MTDPTTPSPRPRRILYVTNGFPYPLTSGFLRHYFLIAELARAGHRVILLSIAGADHIPEHAAAMASTTERVEVFRSLDRAAGRRARLIRRLGRVLPIGGGDRAGARLAARVAEIVRAEPIDAVVFSGKRTGLALRELRDLPVVVDMCDAVLLRIAREAAVASVARRVVLAIQAQEVGRTERRMLERGDRLLFASARDREALLPEADDPRAAIVPNGVDVEFWHRRAATLGTGTVVFTGAMNYRPNVDASIRLARSILPTVQATMPDARLVIVGRDPTPDVLDLQRLPGVSVTGFVDDVRPYLEEAAVFAAPLRFGAGIQNKLLEAMAMEVPAVASPVAADGLRTADGAQPPIVIADDDRTFSTALVDSLRRAAVDPDPDAAARDYVTDHFSWRSSGDQLLRLIDDAIDERAAAAGARPSADR